MNQVDNVPQAQISTRRSFSIIWIVPIVALVIGGWLAFKAMSEKGPTITIMFETADGIEADKTMIKYKDVVVGKVTQVALLDDLSKVVLTVEMNKDAEDYLTENTRFWVVRARVAAGEVSGLGTLFSGAYIGISPVSQGKQQRQFTGLEKQPILTEGLPGRHFILEAATLGSLDLGAPVYYRGIKVGQVVEYNFDEQAEKVLIRIFIYDPYHEKVFQNTRFWNAGGIDVSLDASGIQVDTQSLVAIMLGGVAFDLRPHDRAGRVAEENRAYQLYSDRASSREDEYAVKRYYIMHFYQSVRGLSPGAPVEIKGIQVGEVVDIKLQFIDETAEFRSSVLIMMEPERLHSLIADEGALVEGQTKDVVLEDERAVAARNRKLIDNGFRGQLKSGNLLTGQLIIDLDFYPDAPPVEVTMEEGYPVWPTVPAPLEQIVQRVDSILKKVEKVPFDEIGKELSGAIVELTATMAEIKGTAGKVSQETVPKINASLDQLQETLNGLEASLGPDSGLSYNARQVTAELSMAIRSLRSLLDYLDRDPQAILFGKEGDEQ